MRLMSIKKNRLIQFTHCRLVRNHKLVQEDLWMRDGKIINPEKVFFEEKRLSDEKVYCGGAIIAPGYIDLQINGGYGFDFSHDVDSLVQGIETVAAGLIRNGVTSFCPTLVTSPVETYVRLLHDMPKNTNGAGILGVHLEGPFINPMKKGAHSEECIKTIDNGLDSIFETYGNDLENIKIITLAPELDVTGAVIRSLTEMGITVALGHSMADLSVGERAVQHGASLITHLFNAMLPFHHRDPGLVGLLASDAIPNNETVYFGIIADGVHTHPATLRIAYRTHPDGLVLVSDAISALGLEEGIHHIGQMKLQVSAGKAYVAGTNTLCGSIAPLDECVRIFKKATGCSTAYAIDSATLHPAKCLNIEQTKGSLNYGADADFIMLDDQLRVLSTWIDGQCVYDSNYGSDR